LSTEGRTIVLVTHDPEIAAVTRAVSRFAMGRSAQRLDLTLAGLNRAARSQAAATLAAQASIKAGRVWPNLPSSQDVLEQGLPHSSQAHSLRSKPALREIWRTNFVPFWTMLGIILGVSSLVAMSALVAGWKRREGSPGRNWRTRKSSH